jgi:hypothetical protein
MVEFPALNLGIARGAVVFQFQCLISTWLQPGVNESNASLKVNPVPQGGVLSKSLVGVLESKTQYQTHHGAKREKT